MSKIFRLVNFTSKRSQGFTLVELLIVVSIIAVLVSIGIAFYGNAQQAARNAQRRIEIDGIAKALEQHYNSVPNEHCAGSAGVYCPVQAAWFEDGTFPFDPRQQHVSHWNTSGCGNPAAGDYRSLCWYCVNPDGQGAKTTPGLCDNSGWSVGDGNWTVPARSWVICANLEGNPQFFCKMNAR